MADTRSDITIPPDTWVNLYTAANLPVGTAVDVFNKGLGSCLVAIRATMPLDNNLGIPLYSGSVGSYLAVSPSESGLWCFSDSGTRVLVQED